MASTSGVAFISFLTLLKSSLCLASHLKPSIKSLSNLFSKSASPNTSPQKRRGPSQVRKLGAKWGVFRLLRMLAAAPAIHKGFLYFTLSAFPL